MVDESCRVEDFHNGSELNCELESRCTAQLVLLTVVLVPKFPSSSLFPIIAFGEAGVSVGEGPQFPARFTGKGQSKAHGAPTL